MFRREKLHPNNQHEPQILARNYFSYKTELAIKKAHNIYNKPPYWPIK